MPHKPQNIITEIGREFVNLLFGNVYNRTGLSVLIFVIGCVFMFASVEDKLQKPKCFYILGSILMIISILLITKRYFELKSKDAPKFDR